MTVDELFSAPPKVEVKRQPKPSRLKKKQPSFKELREAGGQPVHTWKTYDEQTPEEREQIKQYVSRRIEVKKKESINFNKYKVRLINSSLYVSQGLATKVCNKCGKLRGITFFDKLRDTNKSKNVRRPYCYLCRKKMNAKAYQRRKNAIKS
jgi:hypothetical protein